MKSEEIAEKVKGKMVLIYGAPGVGKTILALAVSRHFQNPVYVMVDTNVPEGYFKINPGIKVYKAQNLRSIYNFLEHPPRDADLIIVDSITSIAAEVVGENLLSPRKNLLLSNFYDYAFRKLARLKPNTTVIVLAHERLEDFESGKIGPRMNKIAIRHVDTVYHMVEEDGKRKLVKEMDRSQARNVVLDWEVVE